MGKRCSVYISDKDRVMLKTLYPDLGLGPSVSRLLNDYASRDTKEIHRDTPTNNDDVLERIEALEMWKTDMEMLG